MNPNQALWEKGDFTAIAAFMRQSGENLTKSLALAPPLQVLDLGCGDGTTALPLAQQGHNVLGIDIATNLVEAGNKRATEAGLTNLKFQQGEACLLEGIPDHAFDLSLTIFGAMFAPKPFEVAKELVRVTRPGGKIVMGNWIPNDPTSFVSKLLKISSAYTPPPPEGFISPMTWGVNANVIERFTHAGIPAENISMEKGIFHFQSSTKSPEEFIDLFTRFYGPTMNAVEAAENNGKKAELLADLLALVKAENETADGTTSIPATFLRVTVLT